MDSFRNMFTELFLNLLDENQYNPFRRHFSCVTQLLTTLTRQRPCEPDCNVAVGILQFLSQGNGSDTIGKLGLGFCAVSVANLRCVCEPVQQFCNCAVIYLSLGPAFCAQPKIMAKSARSKSKKAFRDIKK